MLRPGAERVSGLGGVRKMMGWQGPIPTTWWFSVMSLGPLRQLSEDGVTFKSHLMAANITSRITTEIQYLLDATITMVLTNAPHSRPLNRWQRRQWNCQCAGLSGHGRLIAAYRPWPIWYCSGIGFSDLRVSR